MAAAAKTETSSWVSWLDPAAASSSARPGTSATETSEGETGTGDKTRLAQLDS